MKETIVFSYKLYYKNINISDYYDISNCYWSNEIKLAIDYIYNSLILFIMLDHKNSFT